MTTLFFFFFLKHPSLESQWIGVLVNNRLFIYAQSNFNLNTFLVVWPLRGFFFFFFSFLKHPSFELKQLDLTVNNWLFLCHVSHSGYIRVLVIIYYKNSNSLPGPLNFIHKLNIQCYTYIYTYIHTHHCYTHTPQRLSLWCCPCVKQCIMMRDASITNPSNFLIQYFF